MIFLKNTFKKKNVIGYFLTLFVLFCGLLLLITVQNGLQSILNEKYKDIEFRAIVVEKIEDIKILDSINDLKCVEEIIEDDIETTTIILDNYKNSKKVIPFLEGKYNYFVNTMGENKIMTFLKLINFSVIFIIVVVYIIVAVIIFQFNNDDKENMNILRALGYSKVKLFFIQLSCLFLFFSFIFSINLTLELFFNIIVAKYLNIESKIFIYYILIIFSLYLIIAIIYCFSYLKINKNIIKKCIR